MSRPKLAIIIGSIRPNRFADHPAQWIEKIAQARGDFDVEVLDLKDYPLPLFAEAASPAAGPAKSEVQQRWREKIASFDAYLIVAAEYNHGATPSVTNALDHAYLEWNRKPVAFVGYGGVGAARAIEQLRAIAVELQMAPVRSAVHILLPVFLAVLREGKQLGDFDYLNQNAKDMLDQLLWWANALKVAREAPERLAA
jgi:NAD(P)H-dependent FMN reductase